MYIVLFGYGHTMKFSNLVSALINAKAYSYGSRTEVSNPAGRLVAVVTEGRVEWK